MFTKIKNWFKRQGNIKYFVVEVMPRAWYEKRDVGGMRITVKFVKTTSLFGRKKVTEQTETFNNYHNRQGRFQYNPPYVPGPDARSEDSLWHALVFEDCEKYPFAPINTRTLQKWIDEWIEENKLDCGGAWKS